MFSCEYCENCKNIFFVQNLRTAPSEKKTLLDSTRIGFKKTLKINENFLIATSKNITIELPKIRTDQEQTQTRISAENKNIQLQP